MMSVETTKVTISFVCFQEKKGIWHEVPYKSNKGIEMES